MTQAKKGDKVQVHYKGYLEDGKYLIHPKAKTHSM